jgi:RimJ/RimL family protein N-acetyltransferase
VINGKKVRLRPMEEVDQTFVVELNSDAVVRASVVGWGFPTSVHAQQLWFAAASETTTHRWIVETLDGDRLGLTGLWDVDWHSRNALTALKLGGNAAQRGHGYGRDAIKTVMAFAFYDVGLERLYGSILPNNEAALRAYTSHCGWSVEGRARQHVWRHGQYHDLFQVGVLRSDFDALPDAAEYRDLIMAGRA